jgi:hypothetical protein
MAEPQIVGAAEAAGIAGITRTYFTVLRTRGQVPEPQVMLACGPIWKRSVIERWAKTRAKT